MRAPTLPPRPATARQSLPNPPTPPARRRSQRLGPSQHNGASRLAWADVLSEAAALGTLVLAFASRSILLTVLPTLEAKVEWVGQIRPIGLVTRGINLVFFSFSVSMALCALVASSTYAWMAVGAVAISSQIVARLRTKMMWRAMVLLHEEVRQALMHDPPEEEMMPSQPGCTPATTRHGTSYASHPTEGQLTDVVVDRPPPRHHLDSAAHYGHGIRHASSLVIDSPYNVRGAAASRPERHNSFDNAVQVAAM